METLQPVDELYDQLISLLPMAKDIEVLEEVATSLDLDVALAGGDRRRLVRVVINHLMSEDFDADKDQDERPPGVGGAAEGNQSEFSVGC